MKDSLIPRDADVECQEISLPCALARRERESQLDKLMEGMMEWNNMREEDREQGRRRMEETVIQVQDGIQQ